MSITKVHSFRSNVPVQFGEVLPGTDLIRQYQNGKEVAPRYIGPERDLGQAVDKAEAQAERYGYRQFCHWETMYVQVFGEWCVYHDVPNFAEEDRR